MSLDHPAPVSWTDDPLALALAAATLEHHFDASASENLGYYRTRVRCACGVEVWWGDHDGDPNFTEAWTEGHVGVALAEVAQKHAASTWRDSIARLINPVAFDRHAVYSAESRGSAQASAYQGADNIVARLLEVVAP